MGVLRVVRLETLELKLLCPNHLQQAVLRILATGPSSSVTRATYDMCLLLCLELLMKLPQTRRSVVMRIGRGRRPRQQLRARRVPMLFAGHLTRRGDRRVVDLKIHEDGATTAGLRGGSVAGHGASRGSWSIVSISADCVAGLAGALTPRLLVLQTCIHGCGGLEGDGRRSRRAGG